MLLSAAGRSAASAAATGAPCGPPASGIRPSPANTENSMSLLPLWEREPSGKQKAAWGTMTQAPSPLWSSTELVPRPKANTPTGPCTLRPICRSGCSRKECPAIHHEKVFKLWGVSPGPATPPCPGPGDLTLPEPLSPCLAVVRLQHGSPALTLPCALSHSCWATLLGAAASTELSPSLQARVTGCPPLLPPPPGAGSPLLCHSPGGGWLALGVSRQAGSRERWRR